MKIRYLAVHCWTLAVTLPSATLQCAAPVNQLADEQKVARWQLLFDGKTTQGWRMFRKESFPGQGWVVEDGWLHCLGKGGGDIVTEREFDDFELEWEWKLTPGANSGLKYFVLESRSEALGHEYQMIDDDRAEGVDKGNRKQLTASFYAVLAPAEQVPIKPPGEVNRSRIIVKGNHVEHWLNGARVLEYECGSQAVRAAVAASKFKDKPGFGDKARGRILLQDHRTQVWFRNVRVRALPTS